MDKLKDKLKKLNLGLGSSTSGKFKGTGHVLGGAPPQQEPRFVGTQRPRPRPSSGTDVPPAKPPPSCGQPRFAAATTPAPAASTPRQLPPQPQPPVAQQQQQEGLLQPKNALAPPSPQLAQESSGAEASVEPSLPPSEELATAVGQLASDPHCGAAADVLFRLMRNVLASPGEPKYRRIRLSNPRIQSAVVDASGGVETLLACGFQVLFEEPAAGQEGPTEGFAVLTDDAELLPLEQALQLLAPLLPPVPADPSPANSQASVAAVADAMSFPAAQVAASEAPLQRPQSAASTASSTTAAPPQQVAAPRRPAERQWDAPRDRCTQVLLPTSVEREVPDWFFLRSGAELKAQFMAAVRRRDADSMLMTRATRERLRDLPDRSAYTHATVRVRFPEGVSLQGKFNPGEPVASVFGWVADCLADPLHTYDLICPDRKPLDPGAGSVRDADLLPSATLFFRWTGQSALEMKEVPALRQDLLRAATPSGGL